MSVLTVGTAAAPRAGAPSGVLEEAAASGLALGRLPGNPAKIRLMLDLSRQLPAAGRLRVLDVGAGGRYEPFNQWEPFLPHADRLELVGVDLAHLEHTAARAAELGFPVELRRASATALVAELGRASFDAVVSTQVLEHVPDWRRALREMRDVLRPGGRLYVTCDSGDAARPRAERARLRAKCAYASLAGRVPALSRAVGGRLSGDWERAPRRDEVRVTAAALGLEVERLAHYGIYEAKLLAPRADAAGRLLWLAYEEALAGGGPGAGHFRLLYLRARRPLP